jgi:hypothetical protein
MGWGEWEIDLYEGRDRLYVDVYKAVYVDGLWGCGLGEMVGRVCGVWCAFPLFCWGHTRVGVLLDRVVIRGRPLKSNGSSLRVPRS